MTRPFSARGLILTITLATALAGCGGGVGDPIPFSDEPDALPRPASPQQYPSLYQVPALPDDLSTPTERQDVRSALEADRDRAQVRIGDRASDGGGAAGGDDTSPIGIFPSGLGPDF